MNPKVYKQKSILIELADLFLLLLHDLLAYLANFIEGVSLSLVLGHLDLNLDILPPRIAPGVQ